MSKSCYQHASYHPDCCECRHNQRMPAVAPSAGAAPASEPPKCDCEVYEYGHKGLKKHAKTCPANPANTPAVQQEPPHSAALERTPCTHCGANTFTTAPGERLCCECLGVKYSPVQQGPEAERIARSDLLSCPFCGSLAWLHGHGQIFSGAPGWRVECEGTCHAMTCYWHTEDQARAAWNGRSEALASSSARVEELENELAGFKPVDLMALVNTSTESAEARLTLVRETLPHWKNLLEHPDHDNTVQVLKIAVAALLDKLKPAADQPQEGQLTIETLLRREWWLNHGCPFAGVYGDDGEMQCGHCATDFKRDPLEELRARVFNLRLAAADQKEERKHENNC
jgi:restriction alleviation protein Lar